MPLNLKQSVRETGEVREALRRRVRDEEHSNFSEREIDRKMADFLVKDKRETKPSLVPGNPIFSHTWRNFTKDEKFHVGSLNSRITTLEEDVRNNAKQLFGTLQDLQQEVVALDSFITEEEIKVLKNFTTVHFNAFTRTIDQGLGFNSNKWLRDYKTELPFLVNNKSHIVPGTGLTLPVRERIDVPIVDAVLVGEETDVGDSGKPIVSSDPRNVFIKNKVFRHVIMRKDFDRTTRKYKVSPVDVTLLLTLPNIQLVNSLSIKPVGQSTVRIQELSYINEAGEEVLLNNAAVAADTSLFVLFEPIRTKQLKLTLRQHAPVTKTHYNIVNQNVRQVNKILRGAGFSQLLDEDSERLEGRVFDFSLEAIDANLIIYEPLGIFRSKPLNIESPLGLVLSDQTEKITVTNDQRTYGSDFALPEGTVLNEYYVGATLRDNNKNILLRDLIPVPDSYPVQREYLPLIGGESKLKLFPDLEWNLRKKDIQSVTTTTTLTTVNTISNHGFARGETVTITCVAPLEHPLNGTFEMLVVDNTTLTFDPQGETGYSLNENEAINSFLFLNEEGSQPVPLIVYENDIKLELGTDYQISIDGGVTFLSDWPRGEVFRQSLPLARSGRCIVKIRRPQLDKLYWSEYRTYANQFLGRTNLVRLRNGRVTFDQSLIGTKGNLHTVIVSRADNDNPYITPIIQFYALKVREDVT